MASSQRPHNTSGNDDDDDDVKDWSPFTSWKCLVLGALCSTVLSCVFRSIYHDEQLSQHCHLVLAAMLMVVLGCVMLVLPGLVVVLGYVGYDCVKGWVFGRNAEVSGGNLGEAVGTAWEEFCHALTPGEEKAL
ncbi:hypothetical protein TI39_contig389g00005 [Zymoseptoria brevis]|uniref:Transmembrane protein n=1 Tax=Zymoseptoria brevis TaxID=1047168 RepID=A0A0F4GRH9_9PEZI|nr:hypothetical protein TI39_contig389g00005 [Zymoseptoria brevis]